MAGITVDHPTAPYTRTPPKAENPLCRNLSTTSNATIFTSASLHSHPTEPLLPATTPQTVNYDDHILTCRDETIGRPPCEAPLMIHESPMNKAEKKGYWARNCRRPLKRWKWIKLVLQAILSAWAIYNTVRYFIAFSTFGDSTNQAFCLALGTSTGISLLLMFFSFLLAIRSGNWLIYGVTTKYLSYVQTTMDYLSSFCLLGPAVVNFALIFTWKHSVDPYFNPANRCHLDVDLVWSVSNTLCHNKSAKWAIWLTLAALRLALTLIISIGYLIASSLYYGSRCQRAVRGFRASISKCSVPKPAPSSFNLPHRNLDMLQSESTLCGTSSGEPSPQNQRRLARSHSSSFSQDISPIEAITFGRSTTTASENEPDSNEFLDRFQFTVSQIVQETDEASHVTHVNSPQNMNDIPTRDLPPSYEEGWNDFNDTHINDNNIFNLPPIFPALGYNEFGLPYPPDQNIRVLNGYIRRMPTIESMGSGEAGSSMGASSNRARESILTSSRPPTRNTLLSLNSTDHNSPDSQPPSRTNSLSARAELLVGLSNAPNNISEHGELLGRASPVARRISTPISYADHTVISDTTYSSATSGSGGASSYHTATSESFPPSDLPLDKRSRSVLGQPDGVLASDSGQPS